MRTHLLRTLIKHDLDPQKHTLSKQEINTWKLIIPDVNNELFSQMDFLYRCPFDRCYLRNTVQGLQSECISLLNAADKLRNLRPECMQLLGDAKLALQDLLQEIDDKYADYAAQDVFVANASLVQSMEGIMQDYKTHANVFFDRRLDAELQQVILYPIREMSEKKRCTYGKINYVIMLQEEISTLLEITQGDVTQELLDLLLSMNFNTDGFIHYYQQTIERKLEQAIDEMDMVWLLNNYERRFKNPPYRKKRLYFDVTKKCVCSLLSNFLEERKCERTFPQHLKIHSLIPVEQLSYFFKLLVDADVLSAENKEEFCEIVATMFYTNGTAKRGISPKSFAAKFRVTNRSSIKTVRAVLAKMIKLIDREELS